MTGATEAARPSLAAALPGIGTLGWVRSAAFDTTLILGVLAIALATGAALYVNPAWFPLLLFVDLWVLAFHHVIATFTRLTFDTESLRRHAFLVFGAPPIVGAAVLGAYFVLGTEAIMTLYFYWQWFHYTRQSYGVERLYFRKSGATEGARLNAWMLYAFGIWGVANRSAQAGPFFGADLYWLPTSPFVVQIIGAAAVALALAWGLERIKEYRQGQLALGHTLFMASHVVVFVVGYLVIADVTNGWLVLNVWHNAQYLLIVWLFNTNRFKAGVDPQHRFLSTICQPQFAALYVAVCLGLAVLVYLPIELALKPLIVAGVPVVLIVSQTINFHHYLADGFIWKLRKQPIRAHFGLAS